jgi:thiamine-phosphate pyrophosphorylase
VRQALPAPPLLVITDRNSASLPLSDIVSGVLGAGCRWLMVREKDLDTAALGDLAREIVDQGRPYGACVTVNGDVEAAVRAGAAGVHLQAAGQVRAARARLGQGALIGLSTHTIEEAREAAAAGADYITVSPVFPTDSKPGHGPALGTGFLARHCRHLGVPAVALAGVTPATAPSCLDSGAAAVAAMGTVMRSQTPGAVVRAFLQSMGCKARTS